MNTDIGNLIRTHCHRRLTGGPAAEWMCSLAACLTSRCVTLDGAAIMLQAARRVICCSGRFHKLHLHAKHKKYSWLIRLSPPMRNDFAACVWLPSSLPPSSPFCHWRTDVHGKVRKGTLKVASATFQTLNCCASCVSSDCADKALPVLWPPSCLQDCCLRIPQNIKGCGGIHLLLPIVWQSAPLIQQSQADLSGAWWQAHVWYPGRTSALFRLWRWDHWCLCEQHTFFCHPVEFHLLFIYYLV